MCDVGHDEFLQTIRSHTIKSLFMFILCRFSCKFPPSEIVCHWSISQIFLYFNQMLRSLGTCLGACPSLQDFHIEESPFISCDKLKGCINLDKITKHHINIPLNPQVSNCLHLSLPFTNWHRIWLTANPKKKKINKKLRIISMMGPPPKKNP